MDRTKKVLHMDHIKINMDGIVGKVIGNDNKKLKEISNNYRVKNFENKLVKDTISKNNINTASYTRLQQINKNVSKDF